jgi:kinesin family member 12
MDAALFGYHATIMAYGQTSAGKTYTMFGPEDVLANTGSLGGVHEGITFRCVRHLFTTAANDASQRVVVKASCLEVYNEGIYDLLNITDKQLALKWDTEGGFLAQGLKVIECTTFDRFVHVAHTGMKNRRTGAHALNHESSRSHAILSVSVEIESTAGESTPIRKGKVSFVDLAGSERVKETGAAGGTLKEANSINKSLFTLGKVISALSEHVRPVSIKQICLEDWCTLGAIVV